MSVFIRRYSSDPGNEVFLEVESVNILDLDPPAAITGIGTGTALVVGEFENGPFNTVTEITGPSDLSNTFGELGYRYAGVVGNYPSAISRKVDGAIDAENWNGNGFAQLSGKKFRRLICVRADTSVGSVEFNRRASLTGAASFTYNMEPGQVITIGVGPAGPQNTATFAATAAAVFSGSGSYVSNFVGGESIKISIDKRAPVNVVFQFTDQSQASVLARINKSLGFACADDMGGGATRLTGLVRGTEGSIEILSISPLAASATGFLVGITLGSGDVGNIDAVRFNEIKSNLEFNTLARVDQAETGALRISKAYVSSGDYIYVSATTAPSLGFVAGDYASNTGYAYIFGGSATYPTGFFTGVALTLAHDGEAPFVVTFLTSDQSQASVVSRINQAAGYGMATINGNQLILRSKKNGGSVSVVSGDLGLLSTLGLIIKSQKSTGVTSGDIPAGTLLRDTSGQLFVTMQTAPVNVASPGPYNVKVRHAVDDGSGVSALAGSISSTVLPVSIGAFDVVNLLNVKAALTEGQLDAAYSDAIDATLNANTQARITNVIWSARQSNAVRRKLRANVNEASSIGMFGRICTLRAPINTLKATAESAVAEPGVGAYRDQRVVYMYPNVQAFVPQIAARGLSGGEGFTATGIINLGADGFMASILSQLPPEENPGQTTSFTTGIVGIENSPSINSFTINDYINFRAAGIAAFRMDDGVAIVQSGVTSVDPSVYPNLRNIARRRMADFIQDTLARRCKGFGKRLNTQARRKAIAVEIRTFLEGLLSRDNPTSQRIAGYSVDDKSANTVQTLAQGIFRIITRVKTLSSLDAIVLDTQVGESVEVTEFIPQA